VAPRALPAGENKAAAPPPATAAPPAATRKPRTATAGATGAALATVATQAPGDTPPAVRNPALPSMTLLATEGSQRFGEATVREMANTIERTLAAFNVPAKVISVNRGPTVTQFGVEPGYLDRGAERVKVRVSKIERLSDDLALALAAPSIRIEAPVPGRPYVGIEVPNPQSTLVALRAVLQSPQFQKVDSPLAIALGKDVSGTSVTYDLGKMPHLLIAGATGSGKSVCINAVVTSLLMNNTAQTLRLLMADPKMVELPVYNGIPHLLGSVVVDVEEAVGMLTWATLQMDDRYRRFADVGARNLESYNKLAAKQGFEPLPFVVIVIDELADLMLNAPDQVERYICRLAQMARATGIHLVVATQRPSVDVVTGLIKANFPARIAFAVTSQIDSRVILDSPGAEKLLGRGDMLLMTADSAKLRRVQGCYVSEREIERVVDFWRKQVPAGARPAHQPWAGLLEQEAEDTEMEAAIEAIRGRKRVSTSLLQRQMRIGYPRAARLMELLEARGYVGPDEGGGRSRLVLFESEADGPLDEDL
jgi:S-DNA-T family DNA segregation ATPase FtsK/SpoIIIE